LICTLIVSNANTNTSKSINTYLHMEASRKVPNGMTCEPAGGYNLSDGKTNLKTGQEARFVCYKTGGKQAPKSPPAPKGDDPVAAQEYLDLIESSLSDRAKEVLREHESKEGGKEVISEEKESVGAEEQVEQVEADQ
jgi:hypothetical protein